MMSQARFRQRYAGMTSVARKVYGAVPIAQSWTPQQIAAELVRLNVSLEFRVIEGCLRGLTDAGLVAETGKGQFRREPVREPKPLPTPQEEPTMSPKPAAKPAASPDPAAAPAAKKSPALDRLADLAERAAKLAAQVQMLSVDIGDAAIEVQMQVDANEAGAAKLRQLQALLKSIGADGAAS